jgi:hypothetical protein
MPDLSGGHLVARTLQQAGVGHIFPVRRGHPACYDGCMRPLEVDVTLRPPRRRRRLPASPAHRGLCVTAGPG